MNAKEAAIKEKRYIEATKKKLMGSGGKLGIIVKYLGSKIKSEGSSFYEPFSSSPYEEVKDYMGSGNEEIMNNMPIMGDNIYVRDVGWLFEGLNWGIHLEIKYLNEDNKLTVDFKGYPVYVEIMGDLERYAPDDEWEDIIGRLHKKALDKKIIVEKENSKQKTELIEQKKDNFIQRMKTKWGL